MSAIKPDPLDYPEGLWDKATPSPHLIRAREIAADFAESIGSIRAPYTSGMCDDTADVQIALAAISSDEYRRGIEDAAKHAELCAQVTSAHAAYTIAAAIRKLANIP